MTEKQAEKNGYNFTGSYSHDKEEQKNEAKKIREQGFKACVVNNPPSRYSRSHRGMGYSVYAEKKYFDEKVKKELLKRISFVENRKKQAYDEYLKKLEDIEKEAKEMKIKLENL
jgi:predicted RNA-binding protein YlxR (DUF448 family)